MPVVRDYEKQVYAAVLGKVIGVYMGRPFEGWPKRKLEERWGRIDRYVHEDQAVPLVVADDDISGTLTFIRALEDSGLYADTPPEFFGDTWLNYLVEGKTVLWWGGLGMSSSLRRESVIVCRLPARSA
jgi:ADP-ribosylglycohydrolase